MNTRGKVEQFLGKNTHLNESARGSIMNDERTLKNKLHRERDFGLHLLVGLYTLSLGREEKEKNEGRNKIEKHSKGCIVSFAQAYLRAKVKGAMA